MVLGWCSIQHPSHIMLTLNGTGYYTIEECGDMPNPTIGMEVGTTYTFVQNDVSNFYHPLGFAYYPDGAHADVDELEPGISAGSSGCDTDHTCPAPMYFVGGSYAGVYSNIPEVTPVTTGEEDFGLDAYEPVFFYPIADWASTGPYSIQLKFDDETFDKDIFYFCHVSSLHFQLFCSVVHDTDTRLV